MKLQFETRDELISFIQSELINTTEVRALLGCSRQNVADLIKRGKLSPVKELTNDRLFFKEDILARLKPSE
ncbi:MAG: transcriptional regulator [Firmicutes bacterium]|nr:transcriptional regulator [Bacillota bacterium]